MTAKSGFFNAVKVGDTYDRSYDAGEFADYFAMFIGSGVFIEPTNQLQVVSKTGLTVTVKSGSAFVDGYWFVLDEDTDVVLSPNSTAYAINDVIVCELNKSLRTIRLTKRESVESILPINTGTIHELVLASVNLGVGVSSITNAIITDRRPYKQYCGFVTGLVEQISIESLLTQQTEQFNEWFEKMKGQLSEDAAGELQQQLDALKENMQTIRAGTENPDNNVGKDGDVYIKIL